jgi:hypothetical protein
MWLRWLILWGTFGISIGLGLGLAVFAEPLGLSGGSRPQSLLLERLGPAGLLFPLEWAAVLFVLLALAIPALTARIGRDRTRQARGAEEAALSTRPDRRSPGSPHP